MAHASCSGRSGRRLLQVGRSFLEVGGGELEEILLGERRSAGEALVHRATE
jgi:hypothetical protein